MSATFVSVTFGQFTVIVAFAELFESFVSTEPAAAAMFAVFCKAGCAHIAGFDGAVKVTVLVLPGLRLLNVQVYIEPLFSGLAGVQFAALAPPAVQLKPVPGITSVRTTLCVPVPPAVTVTV